MATTAIPNAEDLMVAARERTGLHDFGAPTFREGLDVFLSSMAEDADLTPEGIAELASTILARLCNRLEIEDWYGTHPEIEAQQVQTPLFITGLPRTGTSAFANMMSLQPAFRCLRVWEQEPACPPPVLGEEEKDARRLDAMSRLAEMQRTNPDSMVMHLYELDSTAEDPMLIGLEFKAQTCTAPTFSYHAWWRDSDMRPAYGYQKRVVKMLQSRRPPNRWLFKAPHYAFHLEAVCSAYPDARFVITHRDPVKALPSWASFVSTLYPTGSLERIGRECLGRHLAEHQAIGMKRMIEARTRIGDDRFIDVHQRDFVRDPIGEIERVHAFAGLDLSAETRTAMLRWSDVNRPGSYGKHRYTPKKFGLSAESLRQMFLFYTDRYNVPLDEY